MPGIVPGGMNTIIPLSEVSGHLQVAFGRNPKSYPLNLYTSMQSCPLPRGAYTYFNPLDFVRTRRDMTWAIGQPRPDGGLNHQGFTQKNFECVRYSEQTRLDNVSIDVSSFNITKLYGERIARQIMLNRTNLACNKLTNSANYPASNVVTFSSLGGGFANAGTTSTPYLFKALTQAAQLIFQQTGRVGLGELTFVCNAKSAILLAASREIREYVMQAPDSAKMISMEGNDQLYSTSSYLLPPKLYRFNVVVEDSWVNVGQPESTNDTLTPCFPDNVGLVLLREGDLMKDFGDSGYSTATQFVYKDFDTIVQKDEYNQLTYMAVTDYWTLELTAPVTGVILTNLFS